MRGCQGFLSRLFEWLGGTNGDWNLAYTTGTVSQAERVRMRERRSELLDPEHRGKR